MRGIDDACIGVAIGEHGDSVFLFATHAYGSALNGSGADGPRGSRNNVLSNDDH